MAPYMKVSLYYGVTISDNLNYIWARSSMIDYPAVPLTSAGLLQVFNLNAGVSNMDFWVKNPSVG